MPVQYYALVFSLLMGCSQATNEKKILPEVPDGVQAISLLGEELVTATPSDTILKQYDRARDHYLENPHDPDLLIWYGRWAAYKGDYREAIRIYSEGIRKFPRDARMFRHRGHRYISVREFDRAIRDFERAAELIKDREDEVEPDGMPNPMNIPVSTLFTNIYYHMGLAYYIDQDLEKAIEAYSMGVQASTNDDMLVAHLHWLYMALRLLGRDADAGQALDPVHQDMNIIENQAYYQLCLLYKGLMDPEDLLGDGMSGTAGDALRYGIGNWYYYNDRKEMADSVFRDILRGQAWASFGYIAAERHMAGAAGNDTASKD